MILMGRGQIQDVLEFWNKALGKNGQKMIPGVRLTTNQARKTFATFGHRYTIPKKFRVVLFHFPWEALMAVTHHSDPNQFVGIQNFIPIGSTSATRRGTTWKKNAISPGP